MCDYDVVVVGGGPVGVLAGLALSNHGLHVAVLERSSGVYPAPRAVALDDETVRCLGLVDTTLFPWLQSHALRCLIDLRIGAPGDTDGGSLVGPFAPPRVDASGGVDETVFVHQPALEREARRLLAQRGGALIERCAVISVDDEGDAVRVRCETCPATDASTASLSVDDDAPHRQLRARFVVAADGAGSTVRRGLGIAYVQSGSPSPDEPWLVVDVEGADPDICARWQRFNFMNVADGPHRPYRSVVHVPLPGSRGARRFEFQLRPDDDAAALLRGPESAAAVARLLHESLGVDAAALTIVRVVAYTFQTRSAAAWRAGRVLLAGDAAHCMPPFRGQGLCAGVRDVVNLSWKLAAVAASACPMTALDSYEAERAPHVTAVAATAAFMGRLITATRPALLWRARNAAVRALYSCPLTRRLCMAPFAPPTCLDVGALGFAAPPLPPYRSGGVAAAWRRDAATTGALLPNFPVLVAAPTCHNGDAADDNYDCCAAQEETLDAALARAVLSQQRSLSGGARRGGRRIVPPCWLLLLAPHTSSRGGAAASAATLRAPVAAARGSAAPILVIQLLPAVAGLARVAAHAGWRRAAAAGTTSAAPPGEAWWPLADAAVPDATGRLQLWFDVAGGGADAALVRPDRVVWAVGAVADFGGGAGGGALGEAAAWGDGVRRRAAAAQWLVGLLAQQLWCRR